jgi:hypothetical protein
VVSKHWWEEHVQPGMLFVSKVHLYAGSAKNTGAPGSLVEPGATALVVEVEPVAGNVTYAICEELGRIDTTSFLSMFARVEE